ncbi:MAG: ABC transporter permease [Desulfobacterales bacterium]
MLAKLWIRNAARHPLRTALTLVAVGVAILAFGLLGTLVEAWHAGVAAASANRLVVRHGISLTFSLPLAYREKIRGLEAVRAITHMTWFGGFFRERKNFFANFAVEAPTFFEHYPEYRLSEAERAAFLRDRRGCVVGRALAERFGWKVGDAVPLQGTIYPGVWTFTVRGIYTGRDRGTDENQFFFHWDILNERLLERMPPRANRVGIFVIEVRRAEDAPEAAIAVDALFRSSPAETRTETERAFQMGFVSMSAAILAAIRVVSLVIVVILLAVVANTMIMSVRERMREYAVLKTLGFGPGFLTALILGESIALCAAGGALGTAALYPALEILERSLGAYFPAVEPAPETLLLGGLACLVVGALAAAFPVRAVLSTPIVQALGRVG